MIRRLVAIIGLFAACGSASVRPATLDPNNDACAYCRMMVSDPRLAAQIVGPGEEPRFFDDVGCLMAYLTSAGPAADTAVYVADHRTGAWVRAEIAVYTRTSTTRTPMASGILAHADEASRSADPAAAGEPLAAIEIVPPAARAGEPPNE